MPSILKSAALGLGLVTGVALAAQAQSVSSLPPGGAALPPQTAVTQPYGSTQSFFPKPGGSQFWKEDQPVQSSTDYDANRADHPYSTKVGPQPGSFSAGVEHYHATAQDAAPARHPYDAGMGPRAN